ncbi:hypothetical protein HZB60_04175 [candidate division KSB1 bacterium]|nr:hypothetical protein [candidate division KSB1 bacterium]
MEKRLAVNDKLVMVRELTVGAIREWIKRLGSRQAEDFDLVGETLLAEISLEEIRLMTDLTAEDMDAFKPSGLASLIAACREVNPDFFRFRAGLAAAARNIQTAGPSPAAG